MGRKDIETKRIQKCELVTVNGMQMIQFIATGDRHKMMRHDDGSIHIINLPEQGKDYNYQDPVSIDEALQILDQSPDINHHTIAQQIRAHMVQRA